MRDSQVQILLLNHKWTSRAWEKKAFRGWNKRPEVLRAGWGSSQTHLIVLRGDCLRRSIWPGKLKSQVSTQALGPTCSAVKGGGTAAPDMLDPRSQKNPTSSSPVEHVSGNACQKSPRTSWNRRSAEKQKSYYCVLRLLRSLQNSPLSFLRAQSEWWGCSRKCQKKSKPARSLNPRWVWHFNDI